MVVPSDEDLENNHKILCIQARERLKKIPKYNYWGIYLNVKLNLNSKSVKSTLL